MADLQHARTDITTTQPSVLNGKADTRLSPRERTAIAGGQQADGCRACGEPRLLPVVDLGWQPLANRLRGAEELQLPEPTYPLEVVRCPACSLVQLTFSVEPEQLFTAYPYFSSVISSLVAHAKEIVDRKIADLELGERSLAMEIASNDGYLLQHYRNAGVRVLGIDPARNIAAVAEARGIPTRCEFFGQATAERLVAEGYRPDIVHANNVMAHVRDLNSLVAGVATLLGDKGQFVTESPYLRPLLERVEFDTIYHEHLCYFSLTALDRLFSRHELVIQDVERIDIHGGSLRLTVASSAVARRGPRVTALLEEEEAWGVNASATYERFGDHVLGLGRELVELIDRLRGQGARVAAYGASAKGSTLLNTFGIGREHLEFIADASPHKQGFHAPGTALPIVSPDRILDDGPDYLLLLAWNFAEEIMGQQRRFRERGGRFILPVPAPTVV